MTFEEFFKRKKIDLAQLQSSEPALFAEFKNHYEQMGEKSFDHTKKYWFNQLRRRFVPAPEIKTEKVHIENQLAEQTITEALTEPTTPAPSAGFKPRFKTAMAPKPAEETTQEQPAPTEDKPAETPAPAVGFKPRFKASMVTKPAEEKTADEQAVTEEKPAEAPAATPAVGFKPRFKASMVTKPAEEKTEPVAEANEAAKAQESKTEEQPTATAPMGFKPKFRAAAPPKVVADDVAQPAIPIEKKEEPTENKPDEPAPKTVGFKPRFNAAKMKPKEPGTE